MILLDNLFTRIKLVQDICSINQYKKREQIEALLCLRIVFSSIMEVKTSIDLLISTIQMGIVENIVTMHIIKYKIHLIIDKVIFLNKERDQT